MWSYGSDGGDLERAKLNSREQDLVTQFGAQTDEYNLGLKHDNAYYP